MDFKKQVAAGFVLCLSHVAIADAELNERSLTQEKVNYAKTFHIEFITANRLKAKVAKNEFVTIIDVRSTSNYTDSDNRIKGAIHVKLRRLKSRLAFAPLKNVPRDSEIVTYCACPSDQTSIRAAQVLVDAGFTRVRVLKGGWLEWLKAGGQVETKSRRT